VQQLMEELFAGLAPHGKASRVVRARVQAALHRPADALVLVLQPVGDFDGGALKTASLLGHVGKPEVRKSPRSGSRRGVNEVRVHHAFVPVEHEVRVEPVIQRAVALAHCAVASSAPRVTIGLDCRQCLRPFSIVYLL